MVNFIKVKTLWEGQKFWKKHVQLKGLLSNIGGRFVQISVAFSENLNFIKKINKQVGLLRFSEKNHRGSHRKYEFYLPLRNYVMYNY